MPAAKMNAAVAVAGVAQVASVELTELKDVKAVNPMTVSTAKQLPQQFYPAERETVNNSCEETLQTSKQTAETSPVLSANTRGKYQSQPDAYVVHPPYQCYITPPSIHTLSVPGATAMIPPGQHQFLQGQTQICPPCQVAYQPPMNSCGEGDLVMPNEQQSPFQANYEFTSQPLQSCADAALFYQYGWHYHSPSLMPQHHPYQDPSQPFNQFQQAGGLPTLRTTYGYSAFQGVPSDPTKQHHFHRNQHQHDNKTSLVDCQQDLEYYCNCQYQTQPARPFSKAPKEPEKDARSANAASTTTERANANHATRSVRSSTDFVKVQASTAKVTKAPASDLVSSVPGSHLRPTESVGNREWYQREKNLSSDSGWISDNSSSKEESEHADEMASLSPSAINDLSGQFQHNLCLEHSRSSSTDDSFQESQSSSVSSQCPSTSGENEQRHAPPTKHHHAQQPRVMKAIPSRFVNLLHTAAENAAAQRRRLEGYPLFRQMMIQRGYEDHQWDQVYGPDMQQVEFSLTNQPNQNTSWYFPGGYIQFQYHNNPASNVQAQYPQGAGSCVQVPYHQGGFGGCTQGHQSPGYYVENQPSLGGYMQNSSNQESSEGCVQNQYNQSSYGYSQAPASYVRSDQQCAQEFSHAAQSVPLYVIQVDSPDVANSCTLYNDGRNRSSLQSVHEKNPLSYTHHSTPNTVNPVSMQ